MNHEQAEIIIDNKFIKVDKELTNLILLLNHIGVETSGCCIEDEGDYVWIIIQEPMEEIIVQLMQNLKDIPYIFRKRMYYQNSTDTFFSDYILEIGQKDYTYQKRVDIINKVFNRFNHLEGIKTYKTDVMKNVVLR